MSATRASVSGGLGLLGYSIVTADSLKDAVLGGVVAVVSAAASFAVSWFQARTPSGQSTP